ncbi:MAG: zinc carboxypeptidase, partial [Gemmatimonadetes bacterium]|nr:zinc carboxypeptidase [Gemmatimonadota bacterium]
MNGRTERRKDGRLAVRRYGGTAVDSFRLLTTLSMLVPSAATAQVPTFRDITGHSFGERITQHHQMVRYLERLAEASPRVTIEAQGRSWEGRKFVMAVVTSPDNHARIGQIQANSRRLSDPRSTSAAQAEIILASQPAVIWFGGSIHGFELSGSEGALKLLEHLSTRSDSATLEVLENVVVLIDPMLN